MLNEKLFSKIKRLFPEVKVVNCGQRAKYDQKSKSILVWGESYAFNCPFCGDKRKRLYVSHLYGTSVFPYRSSYLWKCFNEECQSDFENRRQLYRILVGDSEPFETNENVLEENVPKEEEEKKTDNLEMVYVDKLPEDHFAVEFLRRRNFDVKELTNLWQVAFCYYHSGKTPNLTNRIVIPVFQGQQLIGFQARSCLENQRPKYLTAFKKDRVLYGFDYVDWGDQEQPIIVVEGVTDVWRYGPGAVAIFGSTLSRFQLLLLLTGNLEVLEWERERQQNSKNSGFFEKNFLSSDFPFHKKPIIFLSDGDDPKSFKKFREFSRQIFFYRPLGWVSVINTPIGKDPADCTREYLHDIVKSSLERRREHG